ncbi:nuclear transport factor 2 family protein [Streptomyces sp. NBC_01341]|uniref:SgcJ/EcaC family oxidoreductase n=1 Tax=Streptomyces sp. NBC_01341 TaxID=2903831 RepID=UPI002E0E78E4|nr:nuclear transport factor 2 family protein [Streptomyces sp. NBC_01341]
MSDVVEEVLARWKTAFDSHRPDQMADLFTPDALFQGFGPSVVTGRDAVRSYYRTVADGRRADVVVLHSYTIAADITGGFADVSVTGASKPEVRMRMSLVVQHGDEGWKIRQYHVSRISAQD